MIRQVPVAVVILVGASFVPFTLKIEASAAALPPAVTVGMNELCAEEASRCYVKKKKWCGLKWGYDKVPQYPQYPQ